ncbi:unnamed protein product [Microthlaspi erraticum]|uniref:Uncharacterized protein n=1 Tax=Microthlaspi erraticum TaxID=1685480 RepID=A0A6D2K249_9BRAS|nr:unnamed protein product [Microthlaspi erraticum]
MDNGNYENVLGNYYLCFNRSYTLKETIAHMLEHHSDTQSVEEIKSRFQRFHSNTRLVKAIAMRNKMNEGAQLPPNPAPTVQESYKKCFDNFFTVEEMIQYMANKHAQQEATVRRIFGNVLRNYGDSDYHDVAQERSVERMMLVQLNEWNRNRKRSVLIDRLSILPKDDRDLVQSLSNEDRHLLCFFISKDFVNREGDPGYVRIGAHAPCFHCHCFECCYHYSLLLDSSGNSLLIQRIIDAYDHAAEKHRIAQEEQKMAQERAEQEAEEAINKDNMSLVLSSEGDGPHMQAQCHKKEEEVVKPKHVTDCIYRAPVSRKVCEQRRFVNRFDVLESNAISSH